MEKKNAIFSKKESQLSSRELKELGQVALSVNQWEGRCQNWGCRMERDQNHTMEKVRVLTFLTLECVHLQSKTRQKLVSSKTLQRMAAIAGRGMVHRNMAVFSGEWMGQGKGRDICS